mmetsp:Transcript_14916/g.35388  ORF Transcript_14916/g.35388 Transcript_14916/m.35388 type:complete len:311 (-) Transcript_14916:167-1099(-)
MKRTYKETTHHCAYLKIGSRITPKIESWTSARRVAMMICCDCPSPRPVLMIRTPTTSPEVRASVHTSTGMAPSSAVELPSPSRWSTSKSVNGSDSAPDRPSILRSLFLCTSGVHSSPLSIVTDCSPPGLPAAAALSLSACSASCVTTMRVALLLSRSSSTARVLTGSQALVGSSSNRTCGFRARQQHRSARWNSPPDKSCQCRSRKSSFFSGVLEKLVVLRSEPNPTFENNSCSSSTVPWSLSKRCLCAAKFLTFSKCSRTVPFNETRPWYTYATLARHPGYPYPSGFLLSRVSSASGLRGSRQAKARRS